MKASVVLELEREATTGRQYAKQRKGHRLSIICGIMRKKGRIRQKHWFLPWTVTSWKSLKFRLCCLIANIIIGPPSNYWCRVDADQVQLWCRGQTVFSSDDCLLFQASFAWNMQWTIQCKFSRRELRNLHNASISLVQWWRQCVPLLANLKIQGLWRGKT